MKETMNQDENAHKLLDAYEIPRAKENGVDYTLAERLDLSFSSISFRRAAYEKVLDRTSAVLKISDTCAITSLVRQIVDASFEIGRSTSKPVNEFYFLVGEFTRNIPTWAGEIDDLVMKSMTIEPVFIEDSPAAE